MKQRLFRDNTGLCPWWLAYTFDNPLRGLVHDPAAVLRDLVQPGHTVLDLGCGLGHFSIGMARLVGPGGRVIAVDLQSEMLRRAQNRARRSGLHERITFHQATTERIGITGQADFALAFWMLHEVSDKQGFLAEVRAALKPGAHFLIVEPRGHVSESFFDRISEGVSAAGFVAQATPHVRLSRAMLVAKADAHR